ncbi:Regulation of nuclear pre-mRNA domain-containing protein 1B, partial [Orchesella cincta]
MYKNLSVVGGRVKRSKMSGFTESALERKLAELNQSQQSIQGLSAWLLHHRKHHNGIVKIWYKEFLKAQEHRKLTFVYLANDVIQNSRKKGAEFGKSFAPILKKMFDHMARIPEEKTKGSVLRILKIWEDRAIYEVNLIRDFESSYRKAWNDLHGSDFQELLAEDDGKGSEHRSKSKDKSSKERDRKHKSSHSPSTSDAPQKRARTKKEEIETALRMRSMEATNTIEEWEVDGVAQLEIKLSPNQFKEKPTEDDLIQMVKDLEKMPSTDAITRGKIANLPTDVSDIAGVDEICIDSDVSRLLQRKIKSAADLLHDYNSKLDVELDDRKKASMKCQDFIYYQKDLLTQAEHRLEEHQSHLKILSKKFEEMKAHVVSMPDLTKLPSVHDGLAPLPSAGDLFNV